MKDAMKPCQHSLSDDVIYKEVVVIGNGPSGMVTSYMLAGNVPYLKPVPEDLPIDEMLKARLHNHSPAVSLYDTDLMQLAEGVEGRSHNPIPLLMDNLLRPCADLGVDVLADSLIEWKFDIDKQIDHIVLGRGPPGGAWHSFPSTVRTLSPAGWLSLPPLPSTGTHRLSARSVASYCRQYVATTKIQRYFRTGVVVTSVTILPSSAGPPCNAQCTNNAVYCVSGYDRLEGRGFRYYCRRVVLACGGGDRPNVLGDDVTRHAVHALHDTQQAVHVLAATEHVPPRAVLVVGSGVSAADAVRVSVHAGLHALHVHKAPADALAKLAPAQYPDYTQIYKMMCDGPGGNHPNYTPYPEHVIVDVTPDHTTVDFADPILRRKHVTLLNPTTNQTVNLTVNLIAVLIGSRPDLFFLQTNFNLNCIDVNVKPCLKCHETKHAVKRKLQVKERQCFLRNHWLYFKTVLGQSLKSCKSRFNSEINGNDTEKCILPDCNKTECKCLIDCNCDIPTVPNEKVKCTCESVPYSSGIGFGVDPKKPVDGRGNPIAIDKSTHELLNAPKGIYALGPLTADNFIRFIPGGALAIVAHMHREHKAV